MKKTEDIGEFLSREKQNILDDLQKLIAFRSYSEDRQCCKSALDFVLERAESFGLKTRLGRYGDVGIVELGEGSPVLGILVHVDVVGEGTLELWNSDPFQLTIKEEVLYGRGVVDDKGPVITCLYAMKYLKEKQVTLNKKVQLIIGTCEEIKWEDMEHFREEFPYPDYGFTPDGLFPIYNRENGYIDLRMVFDEETLQDDENIKGGSAVNSIPSSASYRKEEQLVTFTGKAAHSSGPHLGVNAINLLCKDSGLADTKFAKVINGYFPEGKYESAVGFPKSDGTVSVEGDLTIVPTLIWQEGKQVTVNFNVRHSYLIDGKDIVRTIQQYEEEWGFSLHVHEQLDAINVDENLPWLARMKWMTEFYGMDSQCKLGPGCSYAKSMPNFVSWGPVFPGDPTCAHMENERQPVSSFFKSAEIYALYLEKEVSS